jgi:hypothetical protein
MSGTFLMGQPVYTLAGVPVVAWDYQLRNLMYGVICGVLERVQIREKECVAIAKIEMSGRCNHARVEKQEHKHT